MSGASPSIYLNFVYDQLFTRPPYPITSFESQTVIVTGSNTGLGLEAARHFTRLGAAKVILAVRTVAKGLAAKTSIESSTGCADTIIEVWPLDLSSYASVLSFGQRAASLPRLDVLLENAAIAVDKYAVFEGHESTLTVNVLSTYLLALLLLPKLRSTARQHPTSTPHLVIVSSEAHFLTAFPEQTAPEGQLLATLSDASKARMDDRYPVSKLLEVFLLRELAQRSTGGKPGAAATEPEVVINTVNPGLCHSELGRDAGWGFQLMTLLLARKTEVGSRTLVHAAGAGRESHGQYLSNCKVAEVAPMVVKDEKVGEGRLHRRIWEEVMAVLEGVEPGVSRNV